MRMHPVTLASHGGTEVPNCQELLLARAAFSPYSGVSTMSIQHQDSGWLLGKPPSTIYYFTGAAPDGVSFPSGKNWTVSTGLAPAPVVVAVGKGRPVLSPSGESESLVPRAWRCVRMPPGLMQPLMCLCSSLALLVLSSHPRVEEPTCELRHYLVLLLHLVPAAQAGLGLGGGWLLVS